MTILPAEFTTSVSRPAPERRGILDCFAGIGGFAHALLDPRFGYELALTVELDSTARHVYAANFPQHDPARIVGNIRRLTRVHPDGRIPTDTELATWEKAGMPDGPFLDATPEQIRDAIRNFGVDPGSLLIACGGFPCQTASKAGKQAGTSDKVRGTLFADVIAVAAAAGVEYVLLENVPNLAGARHREWFQAVLAHLRAAGYGIGDTELYLSPDRLPPELMGTPQIRKRLFFAARRIPAHLAQQHPELLHEPVDLATLTSLFDWDPDRWDPEDICDPDDSFDTTPYLLAPRERAWITAWNALLQSLPADDLPTELYVDAFDPDWTPAPGLDPAARRRMERCHAFYRQHQAVCDEWRARTWDIDGVPMRADQFPKSRRILEWQARASQPTQADRDLWQTTFSMRASGIRISNLTTLPALVALNTTSAIGPRGRYITPAEASRLQGLHAPLYAPPVPVRRSPVPTDADIESWPPAAWVHPVVRTDAQLLTDAARAVTDIWWTHGGYHADAARTAIEQADAAGATPGEILLAAGSLAARQPRWRGSGLRWTGLAWDSYRALAPSHPVTYDPVFAAIDWRVRRRATLAAVRAAVGPDVTLDEVELLDWFADRVEISLPSADRSWADRARDIARAVREHGLDAEWLRALHRCALLTAWDPVTRPLDGLLELDDSLAELGVLRFRRPAPAGTSPATVAVLADGRPLAPRLPGQPGHPLAGPSRHHGTGLASIGLPLRRDTLEDGRARLRQLHTVVLEASRRVVALERTGDRDPRAEAAALDAVEEYVHAAYALRRHRALADELQRAGQLVTNLLMHPGMHEYNPRGLIDAAHGLLEAWARHFTAPPYGPVPVLVLPEAHADAEQIRATAAAVTADPQASVMHRLHLNDVAAERLAGTSGIAGAVMAAHYERERSRVGHVLGLLGSGTIDQQQADDLVYALTRIAHLPDLLAHLSECASWLAAHAGAHAYSWERAVQAHAAGLLTAVPEPALPPAVMSA